MEPDVVLSKKVKAKAESGRSRRCHNKKIWNTGPTTSIESRGSVFFYFIGLSTLRILLAKEFSC